MMSKKQPWFKFWAFDWLSSPTITLMTLAERGALISLLAHIWGSGRCCIPDDQQQAMILSGWTNAGVECASGSFDTVWDTLIMMPGMPGFLTHPKLLEQHELTKARSAAGKQNGSKRQAKRKQNESKTEANVKQTLSVSDSVSDSGSVSVSDSGSGFRSEGATKDESGMIIRPKGETALEAQISTPKGKRKRFSPPGVDEVDEYCRSRSNSVSADDFVNWYESNGWVVGRARTPMKNWKAAVRTWEKRDFLPKRNVPVTFDEAKNLRTAEAVQNWSPPKQLKIERDDDE